MKKRKPRGIKKNGRPSEDMCSCYRFGCDPSGISPKLERKFNKRIEEGKCPSCGHEICKCKSKL